MTAPRLAAYGVALALVLGGGAALGAAVGPLDDGAGDDAHQPHGAASAPAGNSTGTATDDGGQDTGHGGHDTTSSDTPVGGTEAAGLRASADGYTLVPDGTVLDPGVAQSFDFRITGPDGAPVLEFEERHERLLHLIVVSRDLSSFAHVHPTLSGDGTWSVELPPLAPGAYRAYADFAAAGGPPLTLGVDLAVPGDWRPAAVPEPALVAVVDGYEVGLSSEATSPTTLDVALTVRREGEPVELEPYLGARGHLVAIRADDLSYLHVHALEEGQDPTGTVRFAVEAAAPGRYRLFLDFSVDGTVRTAAFTLDVHGPDGHSHEEGS